jgi:stage IV sporulation protein FB
MFLDPTGSPYDLNFRLFGTHVRVHVYFWIFTAILGWDWVRIGFGHLLLWIVCVFVSILLHEFGHIWAGRLFGSNGDILLYSFGGLALGSTDLRERWQRIVVYLAGPAIQFALYFALEQSIRYFRPEWLAQMEWAKMLIVMLLLINWYWPLFNLMPIFPLDGGQVMREICEAIWGRNGFRFALIISIVGCAIVAINALIVLNGRPPVIPYLPVSWYAVILFAMLGFESYQLLQHEMSRKPWEED